MLRNSFRLLSISHGTNNKNAFRIRFFASTTDSSKLLLTTNFHQCVMSECKKHESREIRQKALFDEFANNTKIHNDGKLSLKNLVTNHNLCSHDILKSLYNHALKSSKSILANTFNLPSKKLVAKGVCGLGTNLNNAFKKLTNDYKDNIKTFGSDGTQRHYSKDNNKVVVRKNYDYDVVLLSRVHEGNDLFLNEIKEGIETFEPLDLNVVLKLASQNHQYFINKIGNIHIGNVFDGNHVYDMETYDKHYGEGAFISAIVKLITSRYDQKFVGDLSIKHRCTEALIRDTVDALTGSDKELGKSLYDGFIKYTQHMSGDSLIKMNQFLANYYIDQETLFLEMYNRTSPKTKTTSSYPEFIVEKGSNVFSSEYFDNSTMKESFSRSLFINIKKYDEATFRGNFYSCAILCLMK
jgi:hypothetical protein